jgi:hypothetical protein
MEINNGRIKNCTPDMSSTLFSRIEAERFRKKLLRRGLEHWPGDSPLSSVVLDACCQKQHFPRPRLTRGPRGHISRSKNISNSKKTTCLQVPFARFQTTELNLTPRVGSAPGGNWGPPRQKPAHTPLNLSWRPRCLNFSSKRIAV